MLHKSTLSCAVAGCALFAVASHAATVTWTGGGADGAYTNPANWTGAPTSGSGAAGGLPRNDDFRDDVVFGTGTPGLVTYTVDPGSPYGSDGALQHDSLTFTTAGWTLDVDYQSIAAPDMTVPGLNTIIPNFDIDGGSFDLVPGAELYAAGGIYLKGLTPDVTGGGQLTVGSPFGGFGGGTTYGPEVKADTTVRVESGSLFAVGTSSGTRVWLDEGGAALEYLDTIAGAMGNSKIVNRSTFDLVYTDIGGGYVRVEAAIPEPTSLALLGTAGLGLLRRRR